MKINRKALLATLTQQVSQNIQQAKSLLIKPADVLSAQPAPGAWSILQVISHLNTYNQYYLPYIKSAANNSYKAADTDYSPGVLGNYFVNMMQPKNGVVVKKYKAAKQHLPVVVEDGVIETYIKDQLELLHYLDLSENVPLIKNKVPVSISPIIKLRLGDVYRFLVAHQQRHFVQIAGNLRVLSSDSVNA